MLLALYNDKPSSTSLSEDFQKQNILEKLKAIDARARRKGLDALDPSKNPLIRIGMEVNGDGTVAKNGFGVFHLAWQAEEHPEWPGKIAQEVAEIKKAVRQAHGTSVRFLVWAGMGGSAEDKSMYQALGLLRRGPRLFVLDSTDPAKLRAILDDITARSNGDLASALKSTLVVGMALGMTSYEPVVNLEKLSALYARHKIDAASNFVYMALPDSLLDGFGKRGGYRKIELQLDNGNSTSGRHSSPLTRGSLYPLAFASAALEEWIEATALDQKTVETAWRLSAFLNTQAVAGRDKVTLILPRAWAGAGVWTKQDFEESLGKSEEFGLKIVIGEKIRLANYRAPRDAAQDRCFLALQCKALGNGENQKIAALRRAGYPVAVLTMGAAQVSRYMQFMHYVVFGIAWLQKMNFVTQPSVELYKSITNRLHAQAQAAGGIEKTKDWTATHASSRRARYRNALTLHYDRMPEELPCCGKTAPEIFAGFVKHLAGDGRVGYGELTFFGDTRYTAAGKAVRKALDRAADVVYRTTMKMPADVYEGPAMNHSFHEMIIGHGKCFSTVLLSEKAEKIAAAEYTADYHRAQYLATQMALQQRGRYVVALTLKDLEAPTLEALGDFFKEVASALKGRARAAAGA